MCIWWLSSIVDLGLCVFDRPIRIQHFTPCARAVDRQALGTRLGLGLFQKIISELFPQNVYFDHTANKTHFQAANPKQNKPQSSLSTQFKLSNTVHSFNVKPIKMLSDPVAEAFGLIHRHPSGENFWHGWALALIKSQSQRQQRMNRPMIGEGLNNVDDEVERFY